MKCSNGDLASIFWGCRGHILEGENYTGSLKFDTNRKVYSYGTLIGEEVALSNGKRVFLANERKYSVTSSSHLSTFACSRTTTIECKTENRKWLINDTLIKRAEEIKIMIEHISLYQNYYNFTGGIKALLESMTELKQFKKLCQKKYFKEGYYFQKEAF